MLKNIMKKNVMIMLSVALLFFLVSSVSAQGCDSIGWKGYSKIHENKTITLTCPTCDYINFSITNTSQDIFLDNVQMTKDGNTFTYTFLGTDLNQVGTYQLDGYSNLEIPLALCFDVTMTGNANSLGTYTILITLTILFFLSLVWISFNFNRKKLDQMYNRIVTGYFKHNLGQDKGNLGNAVLFTIAYGLLRNMIMFYYLVLIFFMFVMTQLVETFAIDNLTLLFTTILNVTLWGFILVFIVFIFNFYEIIMSLIKDVQDSFSGVYNGK